MNDTTFKLRVPKAELEAWREKAKQEGKSLAGYIRAKCSGVAESLEQSVRRDDSKSTADKVSKVKACIHGTAKGYRCWQCGGIAVIHSEH